MKRKSKTAWAASAAALITGVACLFIFLSRGSEGLKFIFRKHRKK